MSGKTSTADARKRSQDRARFKRAVALHTSRSASKSNEGRKLLRELADAGQIDTLVYMSDWCRDVGQLKWAEKWARHAFAGGESVPVVEVAYEWIYGKEGWDRSVMGSPKTRGRDPQRGLRLLTWAARRGDVGAIYSLSQVYGDRAFSGADDARAVMWTRRGAALKDSDCITNLGVRYFYGEGVRRDPNRAKTLYRRAAALGCPSAAANLRRMYEHGDGVRKNARLAAQWNRRAAKLIKTLVDEPALK